MKRFDSDKMMEIFFITIMICGALAMLCGGAASIACIIALFQQA